MADNNTFDPTDALGPEFGKTNPQNIDPQSLQPFEGDRAAFPDVPEFFPVLPGVSNLDRPDAAINKMQRDIPVSMDDMHKAIRSQFSAIAATPQEKHANIYSYNAGPNSNTFYKRYRAYGAEKFEAIGFSPIRDNEALFNARTSTWDDFSRMATNSLWPLFSKGFVAGPESLFNAMSGDFGVDLEQARAYAEASAIGQSSKDGFGAFMSNTTMSFAYTAGIITEAIVEEVAGALLAAPTGGASFFAATANNMRKAGKIFSAADATFDGLRAVNKTVKGMDNAADARKFWQTSTGKFLNPLENVTDAWSDIRKGQAAGDNITNLAKMYKTAGGFYRDIRNVNMALAEARLEGGFVQEDLYQELYDEYYLEHGKAPDNATQKEMMKQAQAAGTETVLWNTMLIYGSNKILLPNLLGPRGGIRRALTSKTDDILDLKTGKVIFDKAKKAGKKGPKADVKPEFKWRENSFKGNLKNFGKQPLGKTALGVMGYFKANVSEGLQENAQEVISEVNKAYYKQMFEDPAVVNREFTRGLLSHAIDSQLSAQGLETFASGFMMGMFAKPLNAALPAFNVGYNKMFDKDGYAAYKKAKAQTGENVAAALNDLYSDPKKFFDSKLFNYAVQNKADDVIKDSPRMETISAKEEALISQIITAMDTNTMDYFKEHLSSMKKLTPEEFEEAFGFEKGTGAEYQSRIDSIISRAESIERSYKNVKKKFPNPVDLSKYERGTEEYNKASLLSSAWTMGYRNAVFFGESFTDTTERMNDIMNSFATDLDFSKVSSTDLQAMFDLPRMYNEADMMKTQIKGLEQSENLDRAGKKLLKDTKVKLEAYENFMTSLDTFMQYFTIESMSAEDTAAHKKALAIDLGKEPTDEEFREALEAKYSAFRNEENDTKATNDFEQAFKKYLRTIADLSGDHIFNKNIDEAFDKLVDFYRLERESRAMSFYANLLANPADFRDHVERNYEWMSQLYADRKGYYDNLVTSAMDRIEDNALLNQLANENIYVNPEDFAKFKETGMIPEEFYDASRKKVIPQGTPDYDKYASIFKMKALMDLAAEARAHPLNKALEKKIAELQKEMQNKIDALPKVETKEDLGAIKKPKLKKLTIKHVVKETNDKEYVTVTYKKGDTEETAVYYMDGEVLKHNNAEGKEVNVDAITTTFLSAQKHKVISKPDPAAEAAIREDYKERELRLIEEFRDSGTFQEYIPITISTPIDQLPSKLKDELLTALKAEVAQTPGLYEGTEEEMLTAFMESPTASDIIGKYNEEQEALHVLGQQAVPQAPMLAIDGKELDSSTMSADKLRYYIKRYQEEIKALEAKPKMNDEDRKKHAAYKTVLADLVDYADWKLKIDRPEAMQEAVSKIEAIKVGQDEITKTKSAYWINGQAYQRVTKSLEGLKNETYEHPDSDKIIAHYQATIGQGGTVIEFMNLIKADKSLRGFTDISYDYLMPRIEILTARLKSKPTKARVEVIKTAINIKEQDLVQDRASEWSTPESIAELESQLTELYKELPLSEDAFEEALKAEINDSTYMEARIGGTGLDGLVRDFFTNLDKEFTWTPEGLGTFISKEAFNELFGPEGVMTTLRQEVRNNNYYVNAEGLVLYDSKTKIAGEVDLIVVDKAGNTHIVDLKTGTTNTWKHFKSTEKGQKNSKVEQYELQQLAYRNLLYNMTGVTASINLLPIVRETENNTGKITTASLVTELIPIDAKYWFELTPDAETVSRIDNHIPKRDESTQEIPQEVKNIIEEPTGEDSDQVAEPDVEVIGLSEQSTLDQMVDQNVYFEGKAYRLKKVNRKKKTPRYELYSPTKTLYLTDVTGETTIAEAGLNLPAEREAVVSKYKVEIKNEKEVVVNDMKYDIVTDKNGNIVSLIPANNPKQRIKNEALMVAVEVQRNKDNYQEIAEANTEEEPITHEDLEGAMNEEDYITTSLIQNVYNKNMNSTVATALDKLFNAEQIPLTQEERLALDLWVTDAIIDMTKLYNNKPVPQVGKALDNLETINILLYTGDYEDYQREEYSDESNTDEPTKGATEVSPRKKKEASERKQKSVAKEEAPTATMMTFEEVKEKIAKSTDIATVRGELMIAYQEEKIDNNTLTKISGLLLEREQELDQGINIELTFDNMEEGMELIVKNDIFTGNKVFAEKYQTVIVTKAADGSISVKPLGSTESRTYQDIGLINNHFTTMELEKAKGKITEKPLTVEDKELIKETADTVQVFIQTEMNNKSNEANAQSLEDIEDELFNNLDC